MADLAKVQKLLNTDVKFREAFLAAPAKTLQASGIVLDKKMEKSLGTLVTKMKARPAPVAGSSVGVASSQDVGISISISKNF